MRTALATSTPPARPCCSTRPAPPGSVCWAARPTASSGTLTITYDDGTTQDAAVGFPDWAPGGAADLPPSFDNRVVATTPYRDSTGGESQEMEVHVFTTAPIPPAPGGRVRSVTLPAPSSSAFAVAVA